MKAKRNAWLVNGVRTPVGSFGKSLKSVTVDRLASHVMQAALRRSGVEGSELDEVILGHGFQSGLTPNTARVAANQAGIPDSVPALTVQRQCGSGMEAANLAAEKIWLAKADLVLAGGAESMSTVPFILPGKLRWDAWQNFLEKRLGIPRMGPRLTSAAGPAAVAFIVAVLGLIASFFSGTTAVVALVVAAIAGGIALKQAFGEMADNGIAPRALLTDPRTVWMSGTAQRLADTYQITRRQADEFALRSQERAYAAINSGRFDVEIEPIETTRGFFARDEHARGTSAQNAKGTNLESLSRLKGVLKTRDITAGNSSGINDGACALVIASDEKVAELGVKPLALLVDHAVAGVDAEQMGIGPYEAIKKLLAANGLTIADIDLIEINEAFAAQYLACEKLLGLDREKVNVNGGAIAIGHPIGMSGARLILTLAHELKLRGKKRGIAALCIGGGMGIATLIENPEVA